MLSKKNVKPPCDIFAVACSRPKTTPRSMSSNKHGDSSNDAVTPLRKSVLPIVTKSNETIYKTTTTSKIPPEHPKKVKPNSCLASQCSQNKEIAGKDWNHGNECHKAHVPQQVLSRKKTTSALVVNETLKSSSSLKVLEQKNKSSEASLFVALPSHVLIASPSHVLMNRKRKSLVIPPRSTKMFGRDKKVPLTSSSRSAQNKTGKMKNMPGSKNLNKRKLPGGGINDTQYIPPKRKNRKHKQYSATKLPPLSLHTSSSFHKTTGFEEREDHKGSNDEIFIVEKILSDRPAGAGKRKEYLIKWKGYSDCHNSWEHERNILDPILIRRYLCRKTLKILEKTPQSNDANSATSRCISALRFGILEMEDHPKAPFDSKERVCPFCLVTVQNYTKFGGHVRKHRKEEDNYELLKEVSRLVPMAWYEKRSS